jgi:NNP family nitrate/nitrite transporter-like MFS transporter
VADVTRSRQWFKEIVLLLVVIATVSLLRLIPGEVGGNLKRQYKIFGNTHTWVMTIIYTMTFGSFIGYAATFALAIKVVFGYQQRWPSRWFSVINTLRLTA